MVEIVTEHERKMPEKERRQLNISLSNEEYRELERRAKETGRTYKEVICEDMNLGQKMELSHSANLHEGLLGIKDNDVSPEVLAAMKKHGNFFGLNLKAAARDVAVFSKWNELSDADRLYLVMHVYRGEHSGQEIAEELDKLAEILGTDVKTVRAFFKRIVRTGKSSFDLKED
jgi:hypothetical protein